MVKRTCSVQVLDAQLLSAVRAAMRRALSQLYRHELNHRGLLQPGRKPWYLHSTLVPFEESSSGPATRSRYGMQSMGGLQSMWGLSIPLPPPYTIYKRQSVVLRMSCKPQLSLHKRIQQTGFIYKNSLQKNLENASLCLQKYARLTVWPCGIKNEWTKPLILRNNVCICNLASILLGASVTLEFLIKKIYIVSESQK